MTGARPGQLRPIRSIGSDVGRGVRDGLRGRIKPALAPSQGDRGAATPSFGGLSGGSGHVAGRGGLAPAGSSFMST